MISFRQDPRIAGGVVCGECGAIVSLSSVDQHVDWHKKCDQALKGVDNVAIKIAGELHKEFPYENPELVTKEAKKIVEMVRKGDCDGLDKG